MGFTAWIDKRIANAVDRAVADANAAAAQDVAKLAAAVDALPGQVAAAVEGVVDHLIPGFLRHGGTPMTDQQQRDIAASLQRDINAMAPGKVPGDTA